MLTGTKAREYFMVAIMKKVCNPGQIPYDSGLLVGKVGISLPRVYQVIYRRFQNSKVCKCLEESFNPYIIKI